MSTIFTLEKLYKAYNDCKKHKKNTVNAILFEMNREKNLFNLLEDLKSRSYEISRHICFITVVPTPREIFAADFRDRVAHHLLYNEIYDCFDSEFISNSYANHKGKGTHNAVRELRKNIQAVRQKTGGGYYLKLDIQSFFRSIDKDTLYALVEKRLKKASGGGATLWSAEILWLCRKIIFHNPTKNFVYKGDPSLRALIPKSKSLFYSNGVGLPIGNLTSQFFANVYLNELDHFITDNLGCARYVRYVDDFIIVDENKDRLKSLIEPINQFLQEKLKLNIHPAKIRLQETRTGIDFLGYFVKPTHTLVRQKVVRRFKNKLYRRRNPNDGLFSVNDIPMIQSYLGHFGHANAFNFKKKIANF